MILALPGAAGCHPMCSDTVERMTQKELRAHIEATLTSGDLLPGIRGSFRYLRLSRFHRTLGSKRPRVVKVKTNKRNNAVASLFLEPLLAVYNKLSDDPQYFDGNRNDAFDELMRERGFRHQGKRDKYPYLYTDEAYYIALAEKLLSHASAAP